MPEIRNIAVIAHVDHGKTTLVDALLKQTHVFRENEAEMSQTLIMDSNELERERGITILAKNCSVRYRDVKINIIDTPGHADFSGEVERTLGMADGALLIVDAAEGPMPQTRFVLKKALELKLAIIVVINKIDKRFSRPAETLKKIETLFLELAADHAQLEFPVLYAVGREGTVFDRIPETADAKGDVTPLLEAIVAHVPPARNRPGPFKMVISSLDWDPHLGRIAVGKIYRGKIEKGMKVVTANRLTNIRTVEKLMVYEGLKRTETQAEESGEIVSLCGLSDVKIGETVCDPAEITALPGVEIGEPTLHILIGPNTSPFAGREGQFTTGRQLEERLLRELESNLSLRVEKNGGKFIVSGRGELHLAILLETMRREGYELEAGKPEVIVKKGAGETLEPVEEVSVIVPHQHLGIISEEFGKRLGKLLKMDPISEQETEFIYHIPTRAVLGLRSQLMTATRGTMIYSSVILGYEKMGKPVTGNRRGVLVASEPGQALAYGLENAQGRGATFIEPATAVYEGMIVGINAKEGDISINVCKGKKLTNMRSKSHDSVIQLTPPVILTLEQALDFLEDDELLEITPLALRLRKKHLTELERRRAGRLHTPGV
ncbi:MAG: Small GTP-binding protein [Candidatus Amesbacteria bacterium GW2011_GWB1_47_19]|nr:MAG: Small GTP-binding protein [Candidatus Amesbacteria bacterium GW2011_GWC1_46_24]KKU67104.1 MAG: Small GTP-binding protein [Candidatus Amesbacteria bacterium GW2011_GWB1_47_19]HBC72973.1 translational GTPase TypA [Candidatus Amesbacteria bacterium]